MEQIKSTGRVRTFGEVFTAEREVTAMCDMLPEESFQPDVSFLEPCCGEGVFLLEILRRKFANCKRRADYSTALASVWGMDIQSDNVDTTIDNIFRLCEKHFNPTRQDRNTVAAHIIQCDSLKVMNLLKEYKG